MITTVLVWTLTLVSSHGGVAIQSDINTFSDCERMRIRAEAIRYVNDVYDTKGTCTQIQKVVVLPDPQPAAKVTVTPPQITVQPAPVVIQPNKIIIQK